MKKSYQKPQITKVKLNVKEMVLGACWSSTQQSMMQGNCNFNGAACPYP